MADEPLSTSDVLVGTDITYRQLHHWLKNRAIRPSVTRHSTTREYPQFNADDQARIRILDAILDDLTELGVPRIPHMFVRAMWKAMDAGLDEIEVGRVCIRLDPEA